MKTILVPTDFTLNAETALYFAMRLAKQRQARLILLNVIEIPYQTESGEFNDIATIEERKKEAGDKLKALSTQIDYAGDIHYEYMVEGASSVMDGIINTSKKRNADLIVMGTKGEDGLDDLVFGTITSGVIEKSHCPVFAIPQDLKLDKPIKKITYATNFLQGDVGAIKILAEIAAPYDAELIILHIRDDYEEPEQDVAKLDFFMKTIGEQVKYAHLSCELLSGEDIESKLYDYVSSGKTDVLVMSTKYRNYFGRLFNGSMTQDIVRRVNIPVIAFHHVKEQVISNLR